MHGGAGNPERAIALAVTGDRPQGGGRRYAWSTSAGCYRHKADPGGHRTPLSAADDPPALAGPGGEVGEPLGGNLASEFAVGRVTAVGIPVLFMEVVQAGRTAYVQLLRQKGALVVVAAPLSFTSGEVVAARRALPERRSPRLRRSS